MSDETTNATDPEDEKQAEDVSALKNAFARTKRELKEAKAKLSGFDGIDPDEYRELKERHAELERQEAEAKGQYDEALQKATAKLQKRAEDAEKAAADLQARLESKFIRTEAQRAIAEAGGEDLELLGEYVERRLKVDGDAVRVVDEKGNFRDGEDGEPMTVAQFVEELKGREGLKKLFRGRGSSGTGITGFAATQTNGQATAQPGKRMSPAQAAEYIEAHGADAYLKAVNP